MAYEGNQPCNFSAKADADYSGHQFFCVEMTADNGFGISTLTAGVHPAGVLQNKPTSGQHARICPLGISKVRFGGACSYGNAVSAADSGWATAANSGVATMGFVINGCNSGGIATCFINMANATFTTSA